MMRQAAGAHGRHSFGRFSLVWLLSFLLCLTGTPSINSGSFSGTPRDWVGGGNYVSVTAAMPPPADEDCVFIVRRPGQRRALSNDDDKKIKKMAETVKRNLDKPQNETGEAPRGRLLVVHVGKAVMDSGEKGGTGTGSRSAFRNKKRNVDGEFDDSQLKAAERVPLTDLRGVSNVAINKNTKTLVLDFSPDTTLADVEEVAARMLRSKQVVVVQTDFKGMLRNAPNMASYNLESAWEEMTSKYVPPNGNSAYSQIDTVPSPPPSQYNNENHSPNAVKGNDKPNTVNGYGGPNIGYGSPNIGYGGPNNGYGNPYIGYGSHNKYGNPYIGYGSPNIGYGSPNTVKGNDRPNTVNGNGSSNTVKGNGNPNTENIGKPKDNNGNGSSNTVKGNGNPNTENIGKPKDKVEGKPPPPSMTSQDTRHPQIPNDPLFRLQWSLDNPWGNHIQALDAWSIHTGSDLPREQRVKVAVVDSGIDVDHPDLHDNMWVNPGEIPDNGIDDDENGCIDDVHGCNFELRQPNGDVSDSVGHGTHCAGTIGAVGNNGIGTTGVVHAAQIIAVRFGAWVSESIQALEYAINMGATISSNSWGFNSPVPALEESIRAAGKKGHLFICSADNAGIDVEAISSASYYSDYPPMYSSTLDNIIVVAMSQRDGYLHHLSNRGNKTVHVASPGADIYSPRPQDNYAYDTGTSMATAVVAGVAALIKSKYPQLSYLDIKRAIISSVIPSPALLGTVITGGMVNAYKAMLEAQTIWEKKSK